MKVNPKSEQESDGTEDAHNRTQRLSAWLDGELEARVAEPLVRELLSDQALQRKYQSWCFVGDALRSQEVAAEHSPQLCARIARALHDEPNLLAPRALGSLMRHHVPSGVAVAAAMAVLILVAVPLLRGSGSPAGVRGEATMVRNAVPGADLASRAGGELAAGGAPAARQPHLDPYFQAHRDFTPEGVMPAAAIYLRSSNESER
jgi:hypothetical protein